MKRTATRNLRMRRPLMAMIALCALSAAILMTVPVSHRPTDSVDVKPANAQSSREENQPVSFTELASLSPEKLRNIEIARLNLLAAQGLPGAEDLRIEQCLNDLDRWATHVQRETDRNLYRFWRNPADYQRSEAYFRILMLITVLQEDLGVRYNPERINEPDFTNSKDLFIHGMIGDDNGGTCVSMPVLYVAVGRRLGYPLKLVVTKGHVFARWDNDSKGERFNIEATNRGLITPDDEYYRHWPFELSELERDNGWYLRSLGPAEELALFLTNRGYCLEDNGRVAEAEEAYEQALRFAPQSPEAASALLALRHGRSTRDAISNIGKDDADGWLATDRALTNQHVQAILQRQTEQLKQLPPDHENP